MCLEVNDAFVAKKKKKNANDEDNDSFKKYNFIFCRIYALKNIQI